MLLTEATFDDEQNLVFDFEKYLKDDNTIIGKNGEQLPNSRLPGGGFTSLNPNKRDLRRGTVVCRHWLRGLCMKGENCEFLHQYDMTKMPECRWGMGCQVQECPFRHVPDEERVECTFYKHGFCIHGPICRYRHIKLPSEECPKIADFEVTIDTVDVEGNKKRKTQTQNEFFKIAICKHWEATGVCPFAAECHFAHGQDELRNFPQKEDVSKEEDALHLGTGDSKLPDAQMDTKYMLLQSKSYENLVNSKLRGCWSGDQFMYREMEEMKDCQVLLLFTVKGTGQIQGVARMDENKNGLENGDPLDEQNIPGEWKNTIKITWLYICDIKIPNDVEVTIGKEVEGKKMVGLLYERIEIDLNEEVTSEEKKLGTMEVAKSRLKNSTLVSASGVDSRWKMEGPGFLVACNNMTFDECFGRMMFGLPQEHERTASTLIKPGTPLFLRNMSDKHLLGIFVATSEVATNIEPMAFVRAPNTPSPFPVQVRFSVLHHAPAVPETDPAMLKIIGEKKGIRIGPLSHDLTQKLANVFASHQGKQAQNSGQRRPRDDGGLQERLIVGIENDSEFHVTKRIIGPGGSHMKNIISNAGEGTKVRLRGRGSGYKENGRESLEPLTLLVSATDRETMDKACRLTHELLGRIHKDYEAHTSRGRHESRGRSSGRKRNDYEDRDHDRHHRSKSSRSSRR